MIEEVLASIVGVAVFVVWLVISVILIRGMEKDDL